MMMEWEVIQDASFIKIEKVLALYNLAFRLPPKPEPQKDYAQAMYGPGRHGFFIYHENELIGAARVMSDDMICSWVAEVCVHPDWQDKGVGSALVETIKERFSHTSIYLDAFLGQQVFFEKRGIKPREILVACSRAAVKTTDD